MTKWLSMQTAPTDGTKIEIKLPDEFPVLAYFGGGHDKGFREYNSCRLIFNAVSWRPVTTQ